MVQLYICDRFRPVKQLSDYKKLSRKLGESTKIDFTSTAKELEFFNEIDYVIEPGDFDVWVGNNSTEGLYGEFLIN